MSEFTPSPDMQKVERENKAGWVAIRDMHDPFSVHVIPINDTRKHSEDIGIPCWCESTVEPEEEGDEVTVHRHNSADGREFSEPDYTRPEGASLQ